MESHAPGISIIIPVKDEADNIIPLASEINSVMEKLPLGWECIWIDDGSTDGTLAMLNGLAETEPRHRFISFEKNAGKSAAYSVGFDEARAELIATLDGDGQDDPADIPQLMQMVESGKADMACGYRFRRKDDPLRKLVSLIANGFRTLMTGRTPVRDVGCGIRVFRRACVASLPRFSGMHRFLPTLFSIAGFTLAEAPVNHRPRLTGKSKYSINNRLWVGLFDTFGVFWLRKRAYRYEIRNSTDRSALLK
jgi:dolichol-phosphate mannosyltransferase